MLINTLKDEKYILMNKCKTLEKLLNEAYD